MDVSAGGHAPKRQRKQKRKNKRDYVLNPFVNHAKNREGLPSGQRRPDQTPLLNGTEHPPPAVSAQSKGLPPSGSTLPCSSAPSALSLPPPSLTVNTRGRHQNPNEAPTDKSTTAATDPSGSGCNKPEATPTNMATPTPAPTSTTVPTKFLAMDCEMVGAGPKGHISQLARCSIVSYDGDIVYDKFIHPSMPVTDYRTRWSGIRHRDLVKATPFAQARKEIVRLLMGKVVVGHAVHNDFKVLGYSHPASLTRDTSRIPPLNLRAGFKEYECASLKRLTKAIFNRDIQTGRAGHSSVEDAKATMELYKVVQDEWECRLASKPQGR